MDKAKIRKMILELLSHVECDIYKYCDNEENAEEIFDELTDIVKRYMQQWTQ
jgi:hypothetical protein